MVYKTLFEPFQLASCKCMFHVIDSYLSGRYARFFYEKYVEKYDDLLQRVKAVVPYIHNIPNSKIRFAYKDLACLLQLLRAAPQDNLVLREAFGNVEVAWNGSKSVLYNISATHPSVRIRILF